MFAIKCMVITFSILTVLRILPTETYDDMGNSVTTFIGMVLTALVVGMGILCIEEFLLYPLMILSVILSVIGLVISMACRSSFLAEYKHNQHIIAKNEFHRYFKKHGTLPPIPPPEK